MKTDVSTIKEIEKFFQMYKGEVMLPQDHGYLQSNTTLQSYSTLVTL